jgi:hypothetical protein
MHACCLLNKAEVVALMGMLADLRAYYSSEPYLERHTLGEVGAKMIEIQKLEDTIKKGE